MIPTDDELHTWRTIADAATGIRWEVQEDKMVWMLFAYSWGPGAMEHGRQLIKAPKQGSPYAEYWPNARDSQLLEITRDALPRCLDEIARLRQLLHAHAIAWDPQDEET